MGRQKISYQQRETILVTGGAGFIGGHLVEKLVNLGYKIIVIDIEIKPHSTFVLNRLNKKVKLEPVDLRDRKNVSKILTNHRPAYIFHLAAHAIVSSAYELPFEALETNIMGTVNVLEAARKSGFVKGIIVASSDKAYGKLDQGKYRETDALKGDHPYESSKSAADLISYSYFKTYNLPVVITRFGNIYGEGDLNFSRIIPGIMKAIARNEELEIRSDGKYIRDYLYVKDVVNGYLLLAKNIEKIKGEAFNFGSKETLRVLDLIKLIEKTLNKKIKYKILNIAKNEIPYQSLDYSKIKKQLGWKPKHSLKATLRNIYKWYSKN